MYVCMYVDLFIYVCMYVCMYVSLQSLNIIPFLYFFEGKDFVRKMLDPDPFKRSTTGTYSDTVHLLFDQCRS